MTAFHIVGCPSDSTRPPTYIICMCKSSAFVYLLVNPASIVSHNSQAKDIAHREVICGKHDSIYSIDWIGSTVAKHPNFFTLE